MKNLSFFFVLLLAVLAVSELRAQNTCTNPSPDYLFCPEGHSMVTAATGIPYIGIAEYAYGISDKTTIGLVYGQTPVVTGYGARVRSIISEPSERVRIYFRAPLFYYPQTHDLGGEPWFLTWPVVNVEYTRDCGRRMWAGIGAVGAVCAHSLARTLGLEHSTEMMGEGFHGGLWNTVQVGGTQPITSNLVAQVEFGVVMNGLKVAKPDDWVGGPPVILTMGLTYQLQ
ncbi:MAG TPA: hypothetical protein VEW28_03990 [Candidatus Kapabacteria bacterium]|nr:hypothetical protein [Candidatus Kapabacteria bacterium]